MPVQFNSTARRQTFFSDPSVTTAVTIYTASNVVSSTLESLNVSLTGACNISVWINDGTTDHLLIDAGVLSANTQTVYYFGNPVLLDGWSVKVQTSNADDAHFTLTVAEETGRLGAQLG